jgi:hypothetical protein
MSSLTAPVTCLATAVFRGVAQPVRERHSQAPPRFLRHDGAGLPNSKFTLSYENLR